PTEQVVIVPPAITNTPVDPDSLPALPSATPSITATFFLPDNLADAQAIQPAAISGLAPRPEDLPIIVVRNLGMQLHPYVSDQEWQTAIGRTRELGISWLKIQVPWELMEPNPGAFAPEYQQMINQIRAA